MYIPRQALPPSADGATVTDTNAFMTAIPPPNEDPDAQQGGQPPSSSSTTSSSSTPVYPSQSIDPSPTPDSGTSLDPRYIVAIVISLLLTLFIALAAWFLYKVHGTVRMRSGRRRHLRKRVAHRVRRHRRSGGGGGGGAPPEAPDAPPGGGSGAPAPPAPAKKASRKMPKSALKSSRKKRKSGDGAGGASGKVEGVIIVEEEG